MASYISALKMPIGMQTRTIQHPPKLKIYSKGSESPKAESREGVVTMRPCMQLIPMFFLGSYVKVW